MRLIDTHCHIEMDAFDKDREDVLKRARDSGVEGIITIGSDYKSNLDNLSLISKYDFLYASVGIHPHDAMDFNDNIFNDIIEWAKMDKVIAIGETGLDYHYEHSSKGVQKDVFRRHLELSRITGLPVIIHSREAKEDTLSILKDYSGITNGVFHCFSGDIAMAERAMEMGFYISFSGTITFKNARKILDVVSYVPDDYLLVETDAPYLAPEPYRGKRNEPSYMIHTVERIAVLRGVSPDDIARITTLNAQRLFRIGKLPGGKIAYKIRDNLYLNITNRCTNRCSFCVKFHSDYVKGHNLRLTHEPSEEELKAAIGDPTRYKEVVFCGYGEPLIRLDTVKAIAQWIKERGGRVRINTNGHGNIINRRNILPELKGLVDSISVSLDVHDEDTYNRICAPAFKNAFREVLLFIKDAKQYIPDVQITVIDMEGVDLEKCRDIAHELDVRLRVRKLGVVG